MSSVSCTVSVNTSTQTVSGTDSANCDLNFPLPEVGPSAYYGPVIGVATSASSVSGTEGQVSVFTNAGAPPAIPGLQVAAEAHASDSLELSTSGPSRAGFASFDVVLDYLHQDLVADAADVLLTDGVHEYDRANSFGGTDPVNCGQDGCEYKATLPFDLGAGFSVLASGNAVWPGIRGVDGGATVNFTLLEADGTTPVSLTPVSRTPEPSTLGLLLFGFVIWAGREKFRKLLIS